MTKGNYLQIALFLFFCLFLVAQNKNKNLSISVQLQFNQLPIVLDKEYISEAKDTLSFQTIKFYITNFVIVYTDKSIYKEKYSYHLIDIENKESLQFNLNTKIKQSIESIQFNIGVDSLASVSGAMEGDLDATKGMYWAWQSGFINLKIEGKSSSCKTRKNKFQFHIGGYLQPNYAMRKVEIPIEKSQITNDNANLIMDLGKFFSEIHLKETHSIMIPGREAMKMADLTRKIFSIE